MPSRPNCLEHGDEVPWDRLSSKKTGQDSGKSLLGECLGSGEVRVSPYASVLLSSVRKVITTIPTTIISSKTIKNVSRKHDTITNVNRSTKVISYPGLGFGETTGPTLLPLTSFRPSHHDSFLRPPCHMGSSGRKGKLGTRVWNGGRMEDSRENRTNTRSRIFGLLLRPELW